MLLALEHGARGLLVAYQAPAFSPQVVREVRNLDRVAGRLHLATQPAILVEVNGPQPRGILR